MSISTQITRITDDRNTIRNKLYSMGLASQTDSLDELATAIEGIAAKGSPSAQVKEGESYTILPGYYTGGTVTGVGGGGSYELQAKTVTPTKSQQTIASDEGYYGLSQVTVNAIPSNFADVSSVTAAANNVLANKTFVNSEGVLTTGLMPNQGAVTATIDGLTATEYTIPFGFHNGEGKVSLTNDIETALAAI